MSAKQTCLLAIDQGTTSSRAVAFSEQGQAIASAQQEFQQIYPHPGWVEHDPEVIWATVLTVTRKALERAGEAGYSPAAIGITNQRETAVIWDRANGRPIANAIVWQDRRTAETTRSLAAQGHGEMVAARAGLVLDPYFSATKIAWLLDNTPGARERAARGELAFGTIDSFLIWRLTGGRVHETDATNASRTSLYNIDEGRWDAELCALFDVPQSLLPSVRDCVADFGATDSSLFGMEIPIRGVAGDQQAATIGQACFAPGEMKSTYGTGAFMLLNTGVQRLRSQSRLLSTIAYRLNGEVTYALEGSILSAGASVQWLRDGLGLIARAGEIEALAADAAPESEVYLVPAFTGLGAPHWDPDARGALIGLTRDAGRAEIAQAALDSTAYQTWELLECAAADGAAAMRLKVDGGMTANDRLLQRLSDICDIEVVRPADVETTAWGAAFLAGLGAGVYASLEEGAALWRADRTFTPRMGEAERARLRQGWRRAVARVASQGN